MESPYRRNIPFFIAFRLFFNARFYYPVLGVLFLDLGLTVEQYALLNVFWAASILALEVPSGALADVIGRKRMVVLAAVLMVVEMGIFAFAPAGPWLFWLLALNRILSGAAEACASGADEALAYDSLDPEGRDKAWPRVLETLMRWQSGGFFVVMIAGAALFDASFLGRVAAFLGIPWTPAGTVRWPVYATLATAVPCLACALALREPPGPAGDSHPLRRALGNILRGARCVATERRILLVLLAAVVCDSFIRLFLTFESNYLRLIGISAVWNGPIGSAMALLGFVAAPLARRMVDKQSAPANFAALAGLTLVGLMGAALAVSLPGLWVIAPLGLGMSLLQFFGSHYLNAWASSDLRATVLSFRGVTINLGYGVIGILFAVLTARLRAREAGNTEDAIFGAALDWLPPAFALCAAGVVIFAVASRRKCRPAR